MYGKERLCPHYTVHPIHIRSCASTCMDILMSWCHGWQGTTMHPRYTVHPVHKFKQYHIV
jgi:hypothetical protein